MSTKKTWKQRLLAITVTSLLVATNVCEAKDKIKLELTKDGKPDSTIVIGKNAVKAARFAAFEIQNYIKQITGAALPIVTADKPVKGVRILVGESAATKKLGLSGKDMKTQEYLIKFLPGTVVLLGKDKNDHGDFFYDYQKQKSFKGWPSPYDDIGTMYAAYDFLRDYCGVKWINPTEHGTFVPNRKTLIVSGNEAARRPFMHYRGGAAADQTYDLLWRSKTDGARKYNEFAYSDLYSETTDPRQHDVVKKARNLLFVYRMKGGGEKTYCNHSFYNLYDRFLEKDNKIFEAYKPELFAKGYEAGEDHPPQLCYSNPETVEQIVKDARSYFDNGGYQKPMRGYPVPGAHWGKNNFALEPMDNHSFCKCENCSKQYELNRAKDRSQHSTHWFKFVNKVAREIKKSHPDKTISTLAYMSREGVPTNLKLEDNVAVHFAVSANRTPFNGKLLKEQLDRLREWKAKQNAPLYLWLYHCFPKEFADNGKFHCFPGHFAHELKRQFDLFDELEVKGVFHCGFNGEVDNYVCYRLMEDPKQNVDKILDDYFSVYGKAGRPLRKMYELIEKRYCSPDSYPKKKNGEINPGMTFESTWGYVGNEETMTQLQKYMDEAYELAETEHEKNLVKLWDAGLWTYMKEGRQSYVTRMSHPIPDVKAPKVTNASGDVANVDWTKAASLGEKWYKRGGCEPSKFKMSGRVCHDDNYLYLELVDHVDPKALKVSPVIACYDDWELYIAGQRSQPFRQYMIGPTALTNGISHGEVNFRMRVPATEYTEKAFGMKAVSDTSGNKWVLKLAFPLKSIIEHPVKAGDDIYLNAVRVRNPKLAGERLYGIDTWVAYTTVMDVDRLAKIHLEK